MFVKADFLIGFFLLFNIQYSSKPGFSMLGDTFSYIAIEKKGDINLKIHEASFGNENHHLSKNGPW